MSLLANLVSRNSGQLLLDVLEGSFESARYSTKSIEAGLIISIGGSVALFIAFCIIRPRHSLIYAPKTKYITGQKRPSSLGNNAISWIKKVSKISEKELVEKLGLDAALFIRFLRMCRNMALVLTALLCCVGIPINVYYNNKSPSSGDLKRIKDVLLMTTPSLISGTPLIAHVCLSWTVDIVVMLFLWTNLMAVIKLRRRIFMTEEYQKALFMKTLMLTEIPKNYRSDRGIEELMSGNPVQAKIGRDTSSITDLMDEYRHTVYKLESVLAKYLKNPQKLPSKRPKCKAKETGETVDAIDYYGSLLQTLEAQLVDAREAAQDARCLAYGFVSYDSQEECHRIAQTESNGKRKHGVLIDLAPRPSDIIWKNIVLSRLERGSKELWGNIIFTVLLIAWIVPNAFIGCFVADISRIGQVWPAFQTFLKANPILAAILQGFISPLITALIFLILPMLLRRMSQWQGKVSKTDRDMNVVKKLYVFFFFNNFFVVTIIGVAWNVVSQIISFIQTSSKDSGVHLTANEALKQLRLGQQIAPAIINASSFWVMYVVRAYFSLVLDLLQWFNLALKSFQKHFMAPTPRQLIKWTKPDSFNYPTNYNLNLFYITIALCFTSIQPIIMPILAVFFLVEGFIKKYLLMYMFVTKVESDGRYWPLAHKCILFATVFGNIIMFAVVIVKGSWQMSIGIAPLPFIIIIFWIVTSRIIRQRFRYFVPDPEEKEQLTQLLADSPRLGLEKSDDTNSSLYIEARYQNPAVVRPLPVPMVHAKAQHLLPQVCHFLDQNLQDEDEYVMAYHNNKQQDANGNSNGKRDIPFDIVAEERLDELAGLRNALRQEPTMDDLSNVDSNNIYGDDSLDLDYVRSYGYKADSSSLGPEPEQHEQVAGGILQGDHGATSGNDNDDEQRLLPPRNPYMPQMPQNMTRKWSNGYEPYS